MGRASSRRLAWMVAAFLALTACSAPNSRVTVGVVYSGGPNPAALVHHWEPGVIRLFRPDGSFVTSRHLQEGEPFTIELPAGSYRLVAHSGDAGREPVTFKLTGGISIVERVVCSVM